MHANDTKPYSPFRFFLNKFMKQRLAVIAGCMIILIIFIGLFGTWIAPYDAAIPVTEQYADKGISVEDLTSRDVQIIGISGKGAEIAAKDLVKLTSSSDHSEVAKASLNDQTAKVKAVSSGTAAILFCSEGACSALQVGVSDQSGLPIPAFVSASTLVKEHKVGDTDQLQPEVLLTDGTKLSGLEAIADYSKSHGQKAQTEDNGFVTGGAKKAESGLQFESMTPQIVTVDKDGKVRAVREGAGLIKISYGSVSSLVPLAVGAGNTYPGLTQLKLSEGKIALEGIYKHQQPSLRHWFGTDHANRDIFSRVLAGTRQTLIIGFVSVCIGALLGIVFGLLAGYYGRWTDMLISRGSDILLSFPGILLAIFVVAVIGPGMINIIMAVAVFTVPIFIRIVRGSVLSLKEMTYVEAARSIGVKDSVIIFRHIFPGTLSVVMIYLTMRIGSAILIGAGLSYLGLGGDVTAPEWGSMLNAAKNNSMQQFFPLFFPGMAIVITVLCFNLLGDGLRDALDPKLKE
ncbi:ABC transporter permease [Paenibacillus roseipurpureus]|uniref:Glutathione transport system permease protein GsiD n=1 Tax=Paenibacillus roseopurpureus TaxID=2918901 RepID=A0AA96RK68_9BACL|nr:ABC transporter permease subunit [Paenibacillus sp. MBLB1832]WNR46113.1 ABC transporter permease subunit [Paenibacillus sp. MBLB1832]